MNNYTLITYIYSYRNDWHDYNFLNYSKKIFITILLL